FRRASNWTRVRFYLLSLASITSRAHKFAPLPSAKPDVEALRGNRHEATVTWVGHSTLLVQLDGVNILTDPVWSHRLGPLSGPVGGNRFTPPGIRLEDLPPIDVVLISHDHYDHLDEPTVRRLARTFNPLFVVPLGIKAWLAARDITNAVELDWSESVKVKGLEIVCTPAQHGSGRSLIDGGQRLWGSWAGIGSGRLFLRRRQRLHLALRNDRGTARPLRPRRAARGLLHAAHHRPGRAHVAGGGAACRPRSPRSGLHRDTLGHLQAGARAVRRAPAPHR